MTSEDKNIITGIINESAVVKITKVEPKSLLEDFPDKVLITIEVDHFTLEKYNELEEGIYASQNSVKKTSLI